LNLLDKTSIIVGSAHLKQQIKSYGKKIKY